MKTTRSKNLKSPRKPAPQAAAPVTPSVDPSINTNAVLDNRAMDSSIIDTSAFETVANRLQNSVFSKLEKDPFFRTGYMYEAAGNLGAAAACYSRSIQAGPSAEAYTSLSHVLRLMGEVDAALYQARQAVEIDPEFGNAWSNLGALLIEKHIYDEAVSCLERALKAKNLTTLAETYFHLARAYVSKGCLRAAISALDECLKRDPQADMARLLKAQLDSQLN